MLNFIICDDNENILNKLNNMLETIFIKNNYNAKICFKTSNPKDLLNYINHNEFDVIFLDIDLKSEISGLDIANTIRQNNKKAYIIFTSAHLEYLMIAYKYKTFDFLAKPLTLERLEETIFRLFDDFSYESNTFLTINKKKELVKIEDILYIQKDGKKAIFKTNSQELIAYSSFSDIQKQLPENFVRCHKSYIVNINKISTIKADNTIIFKNNLDVACYIGPKYKKLFSEVINYGTTIHSMECFN